jgi:FtsP/CotA-like multicopper oxidase with cupredoxin domain
LEGVVGPLVIHSPVEDKLVGDMYDEELLLFVSELYFNNTYDLIHSYIAPDVENKEPIPDTGLFQGAAWFACSKVEGVFDCVRDGEGAVIPVHAGKRYRIRIINGGGFAEFDFSIDGHPLKVIEADGTTVEPLDLEVVRMANGQRYSVIVDMNKGSGLQKTFWVRGSINPFCFDGSNPFLDMELRAVLAYPDATQKILANGGVVPQGMMPTTDKSHQLDGTVSCIELDRSLLVPAIPQAAPDPDRLIYIDATFQIRDYRISLAYFNDTTYKQLNGTSTLNLLHDNAKTENLKLILDEKDKIHPSWVPNGNLVVTIDKPMVVDLVLNNYDDG